MKNQRRFYLNSNLKLDEMLEMVDPLRDGKMPKGGAVCDPDELGDCCNHKPCFQYEVTIKKVKKLRKEVAK